MAVCVCLCLDRLELEANSFPQSGHFFFEVLGFGVPSSKHFIFTSDTSRSELSDIDGEYVEEHSDDDGDNAGEDDLEE